MIEMPVVLFLVASAFLGSVAFAIFLRRMDTPSLKLNQVRRQGELQTEKLDEIARSQIQAIRDATIEFELMVRQSRKLKDELREDLEQYQNKIQALRSDREILETISIDLAQVAGSAKAVASQVDRLDSGLQRLAFAQEEMGSIRKSLDGLQNVAERKGQEAELRLGEIMGRLIQDAETSTRLLTDQTHANVQGIREEFQDISYKMEEQFKQMQLASERISSLNMRLDEKWALDATRLDEKFAHQERNYMERMASIEAGLSGIRTSAVEALQSDLSRIRKDLDGFNLEGIARRDEIISETRRMAEVMNSQIADFHEKHLAAESKLQRISEQQKTILKERMDSLTREWNAIEQKRITDIESRIRGIEDEYARLRETQAENLDREAHAVIEQIHAESGEAAALIRDTRILEEENLVRIKQEVLQVREDLQEKHRKIDTSILEASRIRARVEEYADRVREEIAASSNEIIKAMGAKAEKFLEEQDHKLGRVNQTIDDKISKQIVQLVDRGQLQLDELEKRTEYAIKDAQERMKDQIERARDDFRKMRDDVGQEMELAQAMRDDIYAEIEKGKTHINGISGKLDVLNRAEALTLKLDETVEVLTERLQLALDENSKLDEYVKNFEAVRIGRRELEAELRQLEDQRDRIAETEKMVSRVHTQANELKGRFDELEQSEEVAERLEERMNALLEMQAEFEKSYNDIMEKRKLLEQALRAMEASKKLAQDSRQAAENLLTRVDRAEFRQTEVEKNIQGMESRSLHLGKLEKEIEKVESRFMQMEGLMVDLEEKQKQIGSMFRKIDEIRTQGEEFRTELESTVVEADEKMGKLTAFYQTIERLVDANLEKALEETKPEPKKSKRRTGSEALKKESILSLHLNHKWDADLIADRLKMDPATVRAIINHA
ncbi:MAG: hypothetical protein JNM27_11105 [Leptospirales bacterium]|nr:hypothetical protein [Leptospirales bacterium]